MPRGVKGSGNPKPTKSIEEKLVKIDIQIESLQSQLENAKAKKKNLLQSKKQSDFDAVQKVILDSGFSAEQLKEILEEHK